MLKKKVAVLGLGLENLALVNYLIDQGEQVTVCDRRSAEQLGERFQTLETLGVEFRLGPTYLEGLADFRTVYRSPGLPLFQPELMQAREQGGNHQCHAVLCHPLSMSDYWGDRDERKRNNGHSDPPNVSPGPTPSRRPSLPGREYRGSAFSFLPSLSPNDRVVLELSSFQLEDMAERVDIAVVTNITEDHLTAVDPNNPNYHHTRAEYVQAKTNLFRYQDRSGVTILNNDDPTCRALTRLVPGKLFLYGSQPQTKGAWYEPTADGTYKIFWNPVGIKEELIESTRIKLRGKHNLLNIAAAALAAGAAGADRDGIRQAITEYNGLEHRLEYVTTIDGVEYFDDSFATAPEPTIVALRAFQEPVILIAGGVDKGADYRPLGEEIIASSVKAVILIGKMGPVLREIITKTGLEKGRIPLLVDGGADMNSIIAQVESLTQPGDVVLLSPACASFDLFRNYKERGILLSRQLGFVHTKRA